MAEEAIEVSRSARNPWGEAAGLLAAAPVLLERGEVFRAVSYLQEHLSLSEVGGIAVAPMMRPILAWIYGELGDSSRGLETIAVIHILMKLC